MKHDDRYEPRRREFTRAAGTRRRTVANAPSPARRSGLVSNRWSSPLVVWFGGLLKRTLRYPLRQRSSCTFVAAQVEPLESRQLLATVSYWQFDSNTSSPGLADSVGTYDLVVAEGSGFSANSTAAVHPVSNPDATVGFSGDPSANPDAGAANASLSLPGGSGQHYLNVPSDPGNVFNLSGQSFTFEGWFQHGATVSPDGFGHIIGGTRNAGGFGGYLLKMEADGSIQGYFRDNTNGAATFSIQTSGTDFRSDTVFHHFALVWQDGAGTNSTGYAEIYIDGILEASGSAPSSFSAADADAGDQAFIIGGRNAATQNTWDGRFDEFRFSDVALASSEFLSAPPASSTVAYWQFDSNGSSSGLTDSVGTYDLVVAEGTGFAANSTASINPVPNPDMTVGFAGNPSANPDPGLSHASLSLPGGSGQHYLNVPSDPGDVFNLSGKSFTFEGWFQHNASVTPDGFGHIIGGSRNAGGFGGYLLKMEADGSIQGYFRDNTNGLATLSIQTSGTDFRSDTVFHHFALVWQDGAGANSTGYAEIYVDGVLEASGSAPSSFSAADADAGDQAFIIGGRNAASQNTWDGRFDEFRFSDVALAPSEFLSAAPASPTVAYWEFDDGDLTGAAVGGSTYDLTNNGYSSSTTNLVQPIPNPDTTVGFVGDATNNAGSVASTGTGNSYFIAGASSRDALLLEGNSWTFEGWFNASNTDFDPLFTTRGGQSGDGLLFDKRSTGFNLFIADGGSNETTFTGVSYPLNTDVHFALTFDSAAGPGNGRFELFVNGVLQATHDTALSLAGVDSGDTTQLELLGRAGDSDGAFAGSADEFRISNRVLAPSEFLSATSAPDTDPPLIVTLAPADGATNVLDLATNLVATFDEPIVLKNGGTITITDTDDGSGTQVINLLNAARASVSAATLTIDPVSDLEPNTNYEIVIDANAIEDQAMSPNAFPGTAAGEWTFTTGNTTVAYWQFDSSSGSPGLADSVGGYDLAAAEGTGFTANSTPSENPVPNPDTTAGFSGDPSANPDPGLANASLSAPGGSGQHYLNVPSDPGNIFNLSGKSFTFEGWFQHSASVAPDGFGHIIGGSRNAGAFRGYLVKMQAGGEIQVYFNDGTNEWNITTSGTDYRSDTVFHHFALVWQDGAGANSTGQADLYVDGILEASGSAPSGFSAANADTGDEAFIIGGRNAASQNTWDGRFDEFRFSNVALTSSEFLFDSNQPPVTVDASLDATEDGAAVTTGVLASDDNDDANSLTYAVSNGPTEGAAASNGDGTFTFDPGSDFQDLAEGVQRVVSFDITATDTDGAVSNTSTVTVTVTGVNDPPNAPTDSNLDPNSIPEDAANDDLVGIMASATDIDSGDTQTYLLTDDAGGRFKIDSSSGIVTVRDATLLNHEDAASHAITVQVEDSQGATASATFSIDIANVSPSGPTDSDSADNSVAEASAVGTVVGVTASSTDPNGIAGGAGVVYSITADTSGGGFKIDASTAVVTVADSSKIDIGNSSVNHTITVQATDNATPTAGTSTESFAIAVTNVDPTGSISGPSLASPSETLHFEFAGDDVSTADRSSLTCSVNWGDGSPTENLGNCNAAAPVARTHEYNALGPYSIALSIADDSGTVVVDTHTVNVTNDPRVDANGNLLVPDSLDGSNRIIITDTNGGGQHVFRNDIGFGPFYPTTGIVRIITGDGPDKITIASNRICGDIDAGGGDNYIAASGCADTIVAAGGDDIIISGNGDDTVNAGDGDNKVDAGTGDDVISAGNGRDELLGRAGDDTIIAGAGDDLVAGGTGDDFVQAGDGDDVLSGGSGNDVLLGGAGNDRIFGRQDRDIIVGGSGGDSLQGDSGEDILGGGVTSLTQTQLEAVRAEWVSDHDFDTRVIEVLSTLGLAAGMSDDAGAVDGVNGHVEADLYLAHGTDQVFAVRAEDVVQNLL